MTEIYTRLSRIQKGLKAPKEENKNVMYKSRSAEQILESAKEQLQDGEYILLRDDIEVKGDRYYLSAIAVFGFGKDTVESKGYAREEESSKVMQAPQLTGSSSSYARKYALGGLFAIDDSKDDPDKNKHEERPVKPKNWKSVQTDIANKMNMAKSETELDAIMEEHDADIQAMPDDFSGFISDLYDGIKERGDYSGKKRVKFASVKDAEAAEEKMRAKALTFTNLDEIKAWLVTIEPYLAELDRVLSADKYKDENGKSPREQLERDINFHVQTLYAQQG